MMNAKMVALARTPAEMKADNPSVEIGGSSRDKYGYGTSITLDAEALKKLGLKDLPEVGAEYHIMATGKVTSVSQNASETNQSSRLEIQLTHLCLNSEADDADEKKPSEEKREMYGAHAGIRYK